MTSLEIRTSSRRQMVNVTARLQEVVASSAVAHGLCHVHVPHTTASVVVNESADPDVARDLLAAYQALIPGIRFAHAEGNSDAHFLATVLGSSITLPVADARLALGTWQGVFLVELDGPRTRKLWVTVIQGPVGERPGE
jgi:secondary thiamine-phosphate synthase enzyme